MRGESRSGSRDRSRDAPGDASAPPRRPRERADACGRRRYWAALDEHDPTLLWIDPAEIHHVRDVMRLGPGDRIELLDGSGRWFESVLDRPMRSDRLRARLVQIHAASPEPPLPWLIQALIRPARLEAVIDGATQIGVHGILLFVAARSALKDTIDDKRRERLERLMRVATAQSLGLHLPALRGPLAGAELGRATAGFRLWVAHGPARAAGPCAEIGDLWSAPLPAAERGEARAEDALVIGPEGGFTEEEIAGFVAGGARLLDLGPRRLRAETAALVGLAHLGARLRAGIAAASIAAGGAVGAGPPVPDAV